MLDLSFLKGKRGTWIITRTGAKNEVSFASRNAMVPANGKMKISVKGNDGFVALFE